jgi:hypothetical protein
MNQTIAAVLMISLAVVFAVTFSFFKPLIMFFSTTTTTSIETSDCLNTGGTVANAQCCLTAKDFPNNCLIGACGCSLDNSHQVKICQCPEGKCWNGASCVSSNQQTETTQVQSSTTTTTHRPFYQQSETTTTQTAPITTTQTNTQTVSTTTTTSDFPPPLPV